MSIFDLTGRTAVITGGNGGIGLGIAQALALSGCNVSIWGRNAEKNKTAAATMAAGPGKVQTLVCDVTDTASVKDAMKATLDTFGRVDGCFANAGVSGRGTASFLQMSSEEWHRVLKVNLDGAFYLSREAIPGMKRRRWGRIINTCSLAAKTGPYFLLSAGTSSAVGTLRVPSLSLRR